VRRRAARRGGFTLVEILAVLVIMGLLAAIALPNLGLRGSRMLDEESRRLASSLEFARQRAVMTGVPHRLLVDLDQAAYRVEWYGRPSEPAPEAEAPPDPARVELSPPPGTERVYEPLEGTLGELAQLDEAVRFDAVETPGGAFEEGTVQIEFERDGTSEPAALVLSNESGRRVILHVAPLADSVRFEYVQP
jgi:type II secretion system protein H